MKNEDLSKMLQEVWGEVRESDEDLKKKIIDLEKALTPDVRSRGDKGPRPCAVPDTLRKLSSTLWERREIGSGSHWVGAR
jgi:hypothetical protein